MYAPPTDVVTRMAIVNPVDCGQFLSLINDNGNHALLSIKGKYYPISMQRVFQVLVDNLDYIKDGDDIFSYKEEIDERGPTTIPVVD